MDINLVTEFVPCDQSEWLPFLLGVNITAACQMMGYLVCPL